MQELSCVCNLHHSSWQCQILNTWREAKVELASSWILVWLVTTEPLWELPYHRILNPLYHGGNSCATLSWLLQLFSKSQHEGECLLLFSPLILICACVCVFVCVRACVCARVRVCVCVCVYSEWGLRGKGFLLISTMWNFFFFASNYFPLWTEKSDLKKKKSLRLVHKIEIS